jgi:hypothetical protein
MAEHTPGPWATEAIFGDDGLDIVLGYEVPRAGSPILLGSVFADDDGGPIRPDQARANARLMALAPELLAELKAAESEARNELVRLRLQGIVDGPAWDNWGLKQQRWAALIARAEDRP